MFTQDEEDYLKAWIAKQKSLETLNALVQEKNEKIIKLNSDLEAQLQKTVEDAKAAADTQVKALASTYDEQIATVSEIIK